MANTASIFIIRDREPHRSAEGGFTIVELMIATVMSAIVFAAIFSAYLFMARNLARLTSNQQMTMESRDALYRLAKDVHEATAVTSASDSSLNLTLSSGTVLYTYDSVNGTLTRTPSPGTAMVLVNHITTFTFVYYGKYSSTALTPSPGTITNPNFAVGRIEMRYTAAIGSAANGTQASLTVASSYMVLRGKTALGL